MEATVSQKKKKKKKNSAQGMSLLYYLCTKGQLALNDEN
jgi:hypothetical protein